MRQLDSSSVTSTAAATVYSVFTALFMLCAVGMLCWSPDMSNDRAGCLDFGGSFRQKDHRVNKSYQRKNNGRVKRMILESDKSNQQRAQSTKYSKILQLARSFFNCERVAPISRRAETRRILLGLWPNAYPKMTFRFFRTFGNVFGENL